MTQHDRKMTVVKEMIALFCMLATVGSVYHGKFVPALGYMAIFVLLYNEKKLRRWLRQRRY